MIDIIKRPEGDVYDTDDQMMVEVLLMSGYQAVCVKTGYGGQLIYSFKLDEVWCTIENILTNKTEGMVFTFPQWWRAKVVWQMNLRHLSQTRSRAPRKPK